MGAPGGGGGFNNQTGPILVHIYVKTLTSLARWGPGGGGTSLARWGPGGGGGGFNNQTGPILVHICPPFNNNLHVKYRSNLIRTF